MSAASSFLWEGMHRIFSSPPWRRLQFYHEDFHPHDADLEFSDSDETLLYQWMTVTLITIQGGILMLMALTWGMKEMHRVCQQQVVLPCHPCHRLWHILSCCQMHLLMPALMCWLVWKRIILMCIQELLHIYIALLLLFSFCYYHHLVLMCSAVYKKS